MSDKETWTAEEIREWEAENDGVCPAFRVDHRPERKPLSDESEELTLTEIHTLVKLSSVVLDAVDDVDDLSELVDDE